MRMVRRLNFITERVLDVMNIVYISKGAMKVI